MQIGHALFSLTQTLTLLHSSVLPRRQPFTVIAQPVCAPDYVSVLEGLPRKFNNTFLFPFQSLQPFRLLIESITV